MALAPEHAELVLSVDAGFWCRSAYLHTADALGSRRGELLALRWSDMRNGEFRIARSLTQFRDAAARVHLEFKSTKEDEIHYVTIPADLATVLEEHRQRQREFKKQFGPAYQDHDLIFCKRGRNAAPARLSPGLGKRAMQEPGPAQGREPAQPPAHARERAACTGSAADDGVETPRPRLDPHHRRHLLACHPPG